MIFLNYKKKSRNIKIILNNKLTNPKNNKARSMNLIKKINSNKKIFNI